MQETKPTPTKDDPTLKKNFLAQFALDQINAENPPYMDTTHTPVRPKELDVNTPLKYLRGKPTLVKLQKVNQFLLTLILECNYRLETTSNAVLSMGKQIQHIEAKLRKLTPKPDPKP